jgi:hypothetical protein
MLNAVEFTQGVDILLRDAGGAYIYMALDRIHSDNRIVLHPISKSSMGPLNGDVVQEQQLIVDNKNLF